MTHIKSMSTSKTNYFSQVSDINLGDYNVPPVQAAAEMSQGRGSEVRQKKGKQRSAMDNQAFGISNQPNAAAARSAQLHGQGGKAREIKKLYSKGSKNSEKAAKRRANLQQHVAAVALANDNLPGELAGPPHQTSHSQGKARQNNRVGSGYQNTDIFQNSVHQSSQPTDQNTPNVQATQSMFNPSTGPPMPTGDQYQGFSFLTPVG